MMEEGEEEQAYPDDVFAQYCDFAVEDEGDEDRDKRPVLYQWHEKVSIYINLAISLI